MVADLRLYLQYRLKYLFVNYLFLDQSHLESRPTIEGTSKTLMALIIQRVNLPGKLERGPESGLSLAK